ncbi:MAG: hypothetical protein ISR58_05400 [Anaerolineales bacterium]|nr:hypothetical protein [Chloroflexota bacterium]MBL6980610.1 hypothetical protein [Anaerolineales bacterium]
MINPKISRQVEYRSFKDNPGECPGCGGSDLVNEYQTYSVATRKGKKISDSFVISGDFGWFCASCPTIVINKDEVGKMLGYGKSNWNIGSEFTVLGIADLDAIPANKRDLPIGDPNNPLPLIEFTEFSKAKKTPKSDVISKDDHEEQNLDVLQNIEFAIVSAYRRNRDLTDHNVDMALETLVKLYRGRKAFPPQNLLTLEVYEAAQGMCDWRLGETVLEDESDLPADLPLEQVSRDIIVACLNRLRKSVRTWTKQGGRQGYLNYIDQFLP